MTRTISRTTLTLGEISATPHRVAPRYDVRCEACGAAVGALVAVGDGGFYASWDPRGWRETLRVGGDDDGLLAALRRIAWLHRVEGCKS